MPSPVARQAILLSGTAVKPVWQANFLTASSLPAGLTYTKSGSIPATLFDSTGKLTFQGNNLKTYSNTFTDASWTKGSTTISNANAVADPFGGTQASTITATGAYGYLQGLYSSTTGYNAISSIWVRLRSGNGAINLYNTNGTGAVAKTATSNWQQIYVSGTSGGVYTYLKMEIPNNGDVFDIYQGGISLVTYETTPRSVDQQITTSSIYLAPRLDTNPATLSPAGMLVEQASSGNYAKYSQDFSQSAWGKYTSGAATGSISANSVTDPASTTTGAYISINRAAASEYAEYYQSFTGTAASWTGSFFLKAHAGGDVGKTVSIAAYNGSTVVAGTTVTLTASWVRYSVTGTMAASGSCNFAIGYVASTDYAGAPTQTGAVGFDVAFGQFDNTSFPLSYIPNPTSSTVTRTADVVTFSGTPASAIAGSQGALIVQLLDENAANPAAIKSIIKGTNNILYHDTTGKVGTTDGTNILLTGHAATWSAATRVGLSWRSGSRIVTATGLTAATDTNTASNGGTLYLGSSNGSAAENCWIQGASIYATSLISATLQSKMTVNGPY